MLFEVFMWTMLITRPRSSQRDGNDEQLGPLVRVPQGVPIAIILYRLIREDPSSF